MKHVFYDESFYILLFCGFHFAMRTLWDGEEAVFAASWFSPP